MRRLKSTVIEVASFQDAGSASHLVCFSREFLRVSDFNPLFSFHFLKRLFSDIFREKYDIINVNIIDFSV